MISKEELHAHQDQMWEELDPAIRVRAVVHLRNRLPVGVRQVWAAKLAEHGRDWNEHVNRPLKIEIDGKEHELPMPFHMSQGIGIRNLLREAIKDDELPSGNWDDYYMKVLEHLLKRP